MFFNTLSLIISTFVGPTVECQHYEPKHSRSSRKFNVERCDSIRLGNGVFIVRVRGSSGDRGNYLHFMARIGRGVAVGHGNVSFFRPVPRFVRKSQYKYNINHRHAFVRAYVFFVRFSSVVGVDGVRFSAENRRQNRRQSEPDERNNIGHTGDQNVHLGKFFYEASRIGQKVRSYDGSRV